MTQIGRSWQIRVPVGGTLHRDRSNSRRSLSTTRQEDRERREQPVECRTTLAVLCIEGVWRQELTRVNSTNILDEGLRIGEIGRRMNSKVKLVEIGVYRK
jgi:hypothetical protein